MEANVYEGTSGFIIMSREYFIDWTCDYELVYYPFDTQVSKHKNTNEYSQILNLPKVCKMQFEMTGATRQYVDLEMDYDGVEYTGDQSFVIG